MMQIIQKFGNYDPMLEVLMISLKHIKIQKTNKSFICWMGRGKKNSS
jgi:hypothetical protein